MKRPGHPWKVHSPRGEYLASFRYAAHAAVLIASLGLGATIRTWAGGHERIVWTEGRDGFAGSSTADVPGHVHRIVQLIMAEVRSAVSVVR